MTTGNWEGPSPVLFIGRGYFCVSTDKGPLWVPSRFVRPACQLQRNGENIGDSFISNQSLTNSVQNLGQSHPTIEDVLLTAARRQSFGPRACNAVLAKICNTKNAVFGNYRERAAIILSCGNCRQNFVIGCSRLRKDDALYLDCQKSFANITFENTCREFLNLKPNQHFPAIWMPESMDSRIEALSWWALTKNVPVVLATKKRQALGLWCLICQLGRRLRDNEIV